MSANLPNVLTPIPENQRLAHLGRSLGGTHDGFPLSCAEPGGERHVPQTHLLRAIDRFVELDRVRAYLAPFYSETARPSIHPELLTPC